MKSKQKHSVAKKPSGDTHPGMMGDGTEEQALNQAGKPAARIKTADVDAAFNTPAP